MARPNILFIMSDQHARRVAGCYGDPVVQTPALDTLASSGVTFESAYCPSPICVPSRMSTLTGRWPYQQECWTLQDQLPSDYPTWAHALGAAGYRPTLIGRMHSIGPDQHHGFADRLAGEPGPHWPGMPRQDLGVLAGAQGPSAISLERSGRGQSGYQVADEEVCDVACNWLAETGAERRSGTDDPFCLMVGFTLPHCPFVARPEDFDLYEQRVPPPTISRPAPEKEHPWLARWRSDCGIDTPDPESVRRARTAYYALVTRTDAFVGRIMAALDDAGLRENTLIVYCSDHGEQIGEHGQWWKNTFYEDSVGVPLIFAWAGGLPQGVRRPHVVNLIDVGATLIDAAGAPRLPLSNGHSLLDIARNASASWENRTFSEYVTDTTTAGWTGPEATRQRMIRDGRWKLVIVDGDRPILFDLEADPEEQHDLAGDPNHAKVRADLERILLADWDPKHIARRVTEREGEKAILAAWAANTRPPMHFVRELKAEENWLEE